MMGASLEEDARAFGEGRADVLDDPYPLYARLREAAPVVFDGETAFITRHAACVTVLRDTVSLSNARRGSSEAAALRELPPDRAAEARAVLDLFNRFVSQSDDPKHAQLRKLVREPFSPKGVAAIRGQIQQVTDELLDRVESRETIDVIGDLAFRVPLQVVGQLLGARVEDHDQLHEWSNALVDFSGSGYMRTAPAFEAMAGFRAYLSELLETGPPPGSGVLLEVLSTGSKELDWLDETDVVAMFVVLMFAGHETTTNLIGNGLLALLRNPTQLARLREDPTLLKGAIEEMLRYDAPTQVVFRTASSPLEVEGTAIDAGASVHALLGAANRDPERYEDPDVFDIERVDGKHLGFGVGPHFCLGAGLARLEAEVVLGSLLDRYPTMSLAADNLGWRRNKVVRGLEALPVNTRAGV